MPTEDVTSGAYEIQVLGSVRRYLVIQARGIDPATVPTIVDLHGSGSWPEDGHFDRGKLRVPSEGA
jgi:hypothetical protein